MNASPYQISGQNTLFPAGIGNFVDYCDQMIQIIRASRVDLANGPAEKIVNWNSPYELKPSGKPKKGVLLVHGLLDSPFSLREIGEFFQQAGFLVRAITLPGHGTRPGDLLGIDKAEWIKATQFGLESLQKSVSEIYYVGYSTGGLLGVYHALQGFPIQKLILLSPCMKIKTALAPLMPLFSHLGPLSERLRWVAKREEADYVKYSSIALMGAMQVYQLTNTVREHLKQKSIEIPIFTILSDDDEVICSEAAKHFTLTQPNPQNHILLYTNAQSSAHPQITSVRSADHRLRILNYSHVSLSCSAQNPHYGPEGDYIDYNHYPKKILARLKGKYHTPEYGSLLAGNLRGRLLARLCYNPRFHEMLGQIRDFLSQSAS